MALPGAVVLGKQLCISRGYYRDMWKCKDKVKIKQRNGTKIYETGNQSQREKKFRKNY